jgi:ABC-2 type transport system ATP-binding protein
MPIIDVRNLVKTFPIKKHRTGALGSLASLVRGDSGGEFTAVNNVSFSIERGEMVGYIGPNGAGKSTTIKMLTGILVPTSGEAQIAGLVPWEARKQLAQKIGVVFGQRTQLWWDLALIESLELLRHLYRMPEHRFRENLHTATELLALGDFLHTPVRQLSLGQRMRGDLAAALLHDPEILYLDEPTIGLDIVAKVAIRDFLTILNRERQTTVLLTTHDLDDIERLCPRILVIDHGEVMYDGMLATLKSRWGGRRQLIVDYAGDPDPGVTSMGNGDLTVTEVDGPRVTIAFDRDAISAPEVLARAGAFGDVRDMSIQEPDIEYVIRRMYEGSIPAGV